MRYVVDASCAVAYLLGQGSAVERSAMIGRDVHAPGFLDVEVTQVLRGLLRAGRLDVAAAERGRRELAELGVRRHPDSALLGGAWTHREVCSTYDGLYVALAAALEATLLTRDGKLARGVAGVVDVAVAG